MAREKKKKEATEGSPERRRGEEIDFDFGIGGLFKGIEKLVDLAADLKEAGGEIKKEGEIDLSHLKEGMKGVFGFSIKTAVGGKPIVEPFGNIKKTPKGPTVEEEREPITDLFDEKEEIRIYAEMPGVNQEDIKLDLKEDILDISVQSGDRKYHKEVLLPVKALAENLSSSYKNGILEVKIKK
ncbi:MAG: archaeal heat shock protein Hsp20 [Candidatus Omnitrophota bacterium]|nr:archaeal heat shock protein Hsp20 [Candidatus Omnitrophota bacterium]